MQSRWGLIKEGVQKNLDTKIGAKPMQMEEYMRCYTAVHEFCTTHKARAPSSSATFSNMDTQGGGMFVFLKGCCWRCVLEVEVENGSSSVCFSFFVKLIAWNERAMVLIRGF